jgi:phosphatidylserine/phosphatidylglycerophosphate/cardiolipin synthase-like enzyme
MRKLILFLLLLSLSLPALARDVQICGPVQVFFSPHGGCTEAVVSTIDQAKTTILVQAYSFTSRTIRDALMEAKGRGVHVQVIADRTDETSRDSVTQDLQAAGIEVVYDETHKIAHNKVMIVDGDTVITGSFNWTASAENANAENLIILHGQEVAQVYADRWEELRKICVER